MRCRARRRPHRLLAAAWTPRRAALLAGHRLRAATAADSPAPWGIRRCRRPGSAWGSRRRAREGPPATAWAAPEPRSSAASAKLNACVMSPVCARRQALRFGTSAPKRRSRKRSSDVWSKVFEHTSPPRENGETTSIGTRKPRPIGPRMPPAMLGSGSTVRYSPGVPGGGTGGGTWSKKPPFSSYVTNSAVFAHTEGFEMSAVKHLRDRDLPVAHRRRRVLALHQRGQHPGHLRQRPCRAVQDEVRGELRRERAGRQLRVLLIGLEIGSTLSP